jgi:membrane protein DedA with SNARE-associated domain
MNAGFLELLLIAGPLLLAVLAWAETSGPHGLVVPAGVALSSGAFLADRGQLGFVEISLAAVVGAVAGDWTGFYAGRRRALNRGGAARSVRFVAEHPFMGITLVRTVSFARTLMPRTAGMSGMAFARFWPWDLAGVLLWLGLYVTAGVLVSQGWSWATQALGTGWSVLLVTAAVTAFLVGKWRKK